LSVYAQKEEEPEVQQEEPYNYYKEQEKLK
jgi:hypothetical protein